MLSTARRGPTSIARSIRLPPTAPRVFETFRYHRAVSKRAQIQPLATVRAFNATTLFNQQAAARAQVVEREVEEDINSQQSSKDKQIQGVVQHGPVTRFAELLERGMVCDSVVKTIIEDMGLETMTQVQSLTINETLKGIDVLAQARTGTGKTLAFLIPVLQNIINYDPSLQHRKGRGQTSPSDIRAIIISPTRELAEQIAVEATKVCRRTGVIVQTAVGGTAKQHHLRLIKREGCHILVGTPGRLNDILSDPYNGIKAPNLSAFVLDEADRLLDQGFAPDIKNIENLLPDRQQIDRQTLLYSATVPNEVMDIVRSTMKRDFKYVRTVQAGEQQTHEKVPQKQVVVRGFANMLPAILELCKKELSRKDRTMPFKAIVYFGATAEVILGAKTFQNLKSPGQSVFHRHPLHPAKIIEMHARLTQQQRTKAADDFRRAESGIMFSSDVTARGMDFPNVTHVIQVGIPQTKETYIHRIGRTGRGDKPGEGWLFTNDFEADEVRYRLDRLPIKPDQSLETAVVDMSQDAQLPEHVAKTLTQVIDASRTVHIADKAAAYLANLGLYQWVRHKQDLVDSLNDRSRNWGSAVYEVWSQGPILKVESAVIGFRDPTLEIVIINIPDLTEARQDSLGLDRPNLAGQGQAMAVEGEALKEGAPIEQAQRASAREGPEEITNEEVTDLLTVETAMTASVDRPKEGRAAPSTAIEAGLATGVDEEALDRCTKRRVAPSEAHIKATETVIWAGYLKIHAFRAPRIEHKLI